jgi:hypothetical protein
MCLVTIVLLIGPRTLLQIMCQHDSSLKRWVGWSSAKMHHVALCPCVLHLKYSLLQMAAVSGLSRTGVILVILSLGPLFAIPGPSVAYIWCDPCLCLAGVGTS